MDAPILFPRFSPSDVARLLRARCTSPGQWQAPCPACTDTGEHLSIGSGKHDKLLMKCVNGSGCRFETIIAVLNTMKATMEGGATCPTPQP